MTVSTTASRAEYAGNGVTTVFPVPFRFLENSHVYAVLVSATGVETPWYIGSDYTLTGADNDAGGTLTAIVPPPITTVLVIYRMVPVTQETDYISGDPFPAESHERALDKLTMIAQQSTEILSRALTFPVADTAPQTGDLPAAAARAGRLLAFDPFGRPVATTYTDDQVASAVAAAYGAGTTADAILFLQSGGGISRSVQSVLRETLRANDFPGVDPTGLTDSTTGIRLAVAELNLRGGGVLEFAGDYLVASTAGLGYLFAFINLDGIELRGYGSTITVNKTRTPLVAEGVIFSFINCRNIRVDGFTFDGPVVDITQTARVGYEAIRFEQGCVNASIPNLRVKNLVAGVVAAKPAADPDSMRSRNIHIGNLDVEHCWYGINFAHSGDNLQVDNLRTDTVHRSFFIYGLRKSRANIRAKDAYSWDVNLSSYDGSVLEDIRINYTMGTDTQSAADQDRVILQAVGTVAGVWRDIHINLNIEYAATGNTGASAVRFSKLDGVGGFDTIDRGHVFENIYISGKVKGVPHYPDGGAVSLDNLCSWGAGENLRNIVIDGLIVTEQAFRCWWPQGAFHTGPGLTIRNTQLRGPVYLTPGDGGDPQGLLKPFPNPVVVENSTFSNLWAVVANQRAVGIWFASVDTTVPAGYSGRSISNRTATGLKTDTLPPALPGREFRCVREAPFEYQIKPDPSDSIRGGGSAGKYLSMNANGNNVRLRCVVGGVWELASSNGAITFEP